MFLLFIFLIIPSPEFDAPSSTVIQSAEGELLGARIAADEQWRFALIDSVPEKFEICITQFEDQWFRYHPGFNPISMARALWQNLKAGHIVSGGSTLTMQTVRMARQGKERNIKEKLIELFFALKYELKYSKDEILQLYTSYAPFGGNVVGLEAASWRYYGRSPHNLSWAETATLAVLPNAPSLIYPGRNQKKLKDKRQRLLLKLRNNGIIDSLTYDLSIKEELPQKPKRLPQLAPHLLDRIAAAQPGQRVQTTLDINKQREVRRLLNQHSKFLSNNEIYNAAAIIVDNESGNVIAYVGNSDYTNDNANNVDIIQSPRSTGSIIKPLLFAAMLENGELLPSTLVPDIPVFFEGFSPENYNLQYDGAVPASEALFRSLNIPAVHMLSDFGIARFLSYLHKFDFSSINRSADYYGLSLILGGAEVTLWDLAKVYSGMARTLKHASNNGYIYSDQDFRNLNYTEHTVESEPQLGEAPTILSAASIWCTFEALQNVGRPDNQEGWESFASSQQIAWKTGTSFGFRDAWAVGVNPQYTIGVWVGNADGEGRPGLTGLTAAAPLLFDLFDLMHPKGWFKMPYDEMLTVPICRQSGHLASRHCSEVDSIDIPAVGQRTSVCPYHKTIQTNAAGTYRVNVGCADADDIIQQSWFVLPPVMAYYYAKKNPSYKELPPYAPNCHDAEMKTMAFIYPRNISKLYIPIDHTGKRGELIFEVAHAQQQMKLFWHLDNTYLGTTEDIHQFALSPTVGRHKVTVVDELGNTISHTFEVMQ